MQRPHNINKAIFFSFGYAVTVSLCTCFAKLISHATTEGMIVFSRFSVGMVYLGIILLLHRMRGNWDFTAKTKHLHLHVLRAVAAFSAQFAIFYAAKFIPLATANLMLLTHPLFIPILGAIFLATVTSRQNWIAIIIGFIGIILILKPGQEVFQPAALIGLAGGLFAAISMLGVHEIGKYDKPLTILFYYFGIAFLISLAVAAFSWQTPTDSFTILILLGVGMSGALAQECSIRALINAPPKIVAPMMYLTVVVSGFLDWLVWHETLDLVSWFGIIIVCSSAIMIILLTQKNRRKIENQVLSSKAKAT